MNLTQAAQYIGIGSSTLSKIENDRVKPKAYIVAKINEKLGLALSDSVGYEFTNKAGRPVGYTNKRKTPIGQFITDARIAHNLSQEGLGQLVGRGKSMIHEIETGRHLPSAKIIEEIEIALNIKIPVEYLPDRKSYPRDKDSSGRSQIARIVIDRRLELQLTIYDLAARCGLDVAIISRIENDKYKKWTVLTLYKLESGLGIAIPTDLINELVVQNSKDSVTLHVQISNDAAKKLARISREVNISGASAAVEYAILKLASDMGL